MALLNDLFGIQSRGGCSCAGPYGHRLLGIDIERSHEFEREIAGGCEGIKPGWVRVNFNYFISDPVFDYVVEAVRLVARHGWRLLGDYRFDPATGLWRHRRGPVEPPLRLGQVSYDEDRPDDLPAPQDRAPESELRRYLDEARRAVRRGRGRGAGIAGGPGAPAGCRRFRGLRAPALVRTAGRLPAPELRGGRRGGGGGGLWWAEGGGR